jgi:hypothetical protein
MSNPVGHNARMFTRIFKNARLSISDADSNFVGNLWLRTALAAWGLWLAMLTAAVLADALR